MLDQSPQSHQKTERPCPLFIYHYKTRLLSASGRVKLPHKLIKSAHIKLPQTFTLVAQPDKPIVRVLASATLPSQYDRYKIPAKHIVENFVIPKKRNFKIPQELLSHLQLPDTDTHLMVAGMGRYFSLMALAQYEEMMPHAREQARNIELIPQR